MPKNIRRKRIAKDVADALIALGYTSLDDQAKALDIHRATAWTMIKKKHKVGRRTIERILANPKTPPSARVVVQKYLAEAL